MLSYVGMGGKHTKYMDNDGTALRSIADKGHSTLLILFQEKDTL